MMNFSEECSQHTLVSVGGTSQQLATLIRARKRIPINGSGEFEGVELDLLI